MNTGLQDAANLAWKLALVIKCHAPEELLTSYQDERHFIGLKLIKTTDRFFKMIISPSFGILHLRTILLSWIMSLINRSPKIQKRMFWLMSQLGIHYPSNPWLLEKTEHPDSLFLSGPKPGYRAPDAPFENTTLFELFREFPFNVLIFVVNDQEKNALKDHQIQQIENIFPKWIRLSFIIRSNETTTTFERYGVSNHAIYFIRPDGYIGFRTNELELDELQEYLRKFS